MTKRHNLKIGDRILVHATGDTGTVISEGYDYMIAKLDGGAGEVDIFHYNAWSKVKRINNDSMIHLNESENILLKGKVKS